MDTYIEHLRARTPRLDRMGIATENILIRFNGHQRNVEIKKVAWQNRLAVLAAGIYEDPVDPVNEAAEQYIYAMDMLLDQNKQQVAASKKDKNRQLVEMYEARFGKIEQR